MRLTSLIITLLLYFSQANAQDTLRRIQLPGQIEKKISSNKTIRKYEPTTEQAILKKINYVLDTFALQNNGDPFFIRKVKNEIENVLYPYLRDGSLNATEPRNAWIIKCGSETMTNKDKQDGRLVVIVSLALKKPMEFEVYRFERIVLNKQSLQYF